MNAIHSKTAWSGRSRARKPDHSRCMYMGPDVFDVSPCLRLPSSSIASRLERCKMAHWLDKIDWARRSLHVKPAILMS
jgi:hypothetical protein